ncbi:MAG: DUF4143 domain-containing protein [Candidatus Methanoplasma sp.]|jgi:predicted AAA+ superfamily ATPase|nr:DUF4143 domain-containing protein [Candidatus Methanoplasma sp.]
MDGDRILSDDEIRGAYHPRVIDSKISSMLSKFGGVLITGPKWCGKSWTGIRHSRSSICVADPGGRDLANNAPKIALEGERPRLVDEWQEAPRLWDAARVNIDRSAGRGLYIFTGSTHPPEGSTSHSGTGRFCEVPMRTLSLFESGDSTGSVSLEKLFASAEIGDARSGMDYESAIRLVCRGGWPASVWGEPDPGQDIPRGYARSIAGSGGRLAGGRGRSPGIAEEVLRSLARNTSTSASAATIAKDAGGGGSAASDQTVRAHMRDLMGLYVLDEQRAWLPSLRSTVRMRKTPKRHLADPSLAAALLGAGPDLLKRDIRTAGLLFESMCYRDLCVYSEPLGGRVLYYGDDNGLEIDAVIELWDGRWGAAEVKLGTFEIDKAAANLKKLEGIVSPDSGPPSFLMVLTGSGGASYMRGDGVRVVPMDCLGP